MQSQSLTDSGYTQSLLLPVDGDLLLQQQSIACAGERSEETQRMGHGESRAHAGIRVSPAGIPARLHQSHGVARSPAADSVCKHESGKHQLRDTAFACGHTAR